MGKGEDAGGSWSVCRERRGREGGREEEEETHSVRKNQTEKNRQRLTDRDKQTETYRQTQEERDNLKPGRD